MRNFHAYISLKFSYPEDSLTRRAAAVDSELVHLLPEVLRRKREPLEVLPDVMEAGDVAETANVHVLATDLEKKYVKRKCQKVFPRKSNYSNYSFQISLTREEVGRASADLLDCVPGALHETVGPGVVLEVVEFPLIVEEAHSLVEGHLPDSIGAVDV